MARDRTARSKKAMEKFKIIPSGVASKIRKNQKLDVKRIDQIERKTKHDVIAFLTSIAEKVGPDAKYLHQGMTSSDILIRVLMFN